MTYAALTVGQRLLDDWMHAGTDEDQSKALSHSKGHQMRADLQFAQAAKYLGHPRPSVKPAAAVISTEIAEHEFTCGVVNGTSKMSRSMDELQDLMPNRNSVIAALCRNCHSST